MSIYDILNAVTPSLLDAAAAILPKLLPQVRELFQRERIPEPMRVRLGRWFGVCVHKALCHWEQFRILLKLPPS